MKTLIYFRILAMGFLLLVSLGLLSLASIGYLALVAIGTWCNPAIGFMALPAVGIRSFASIGYVALDVIDVQYVVSIGCPAAAAIVVRYVASIGSPAHVAIGFRSLALVPLLSLLAHFLTPHNCRCPICDHYQTFHITNAFMQFFKKSCPRIYEEGVFRFKVAKKISTKDRYTKADDRSRIRCHISNAGEEGSSKTVLQTLATSDEERETTENRAIEMVVAATGHH
ncbi:unnamed protein product [Lactuca saligna]|uniref:Uncharacterized protein n=1 Tax=Lactuca saligna TaxID=75948 RepID=A0AA35ZAE5_LACSI|nr:unnamed protein product [Lactuca saligna]